MLRFRTLLVVDSHFVRSIITPSFLPFFLALSKADAIIIIIQKGAETGKMACGRGCTCIGIRAFL